MPGLPSEVLAYGRRAAARTGLDEADGISLAAEAWAADPDFWHMPTVRRCIDEARYRQGRNRQHCPPIPVDLVDLDCPFMESGFARVEDADEVDRLLVRLPHRDALILRAWLMEGFTQAEIGAALGVSASRVTNFCTAARQRLREEG
jgi:DNA-directed RNA polymerase specialized sigma24 family protein